MPGVFDARLPESLRQGEEIEKGQRVALIVSLLPLEDDVTISVGVLLPQNVQKIDGLERLLGDNWWIAHTPLLPGISPSLSGILPQSPPLSSLQIS